MLLRYEHFSIVSTDPFLLHQLPAVAADRAPDALALTAAAHRCSYAQLTQAIDRCCGAWIELGLERGERVAVFLDKRIDTVVACFAVTQAAGVLVPINPVLKAAQVVHILRDCNVRMLVTCTQRLAALAPALAQCEALRHVVVVDADGQGPSELGAAQSLHDWAALKDATGCAGRRVIDEDIAAIFYTSGSTGRPKGVVLSHRNLLAGAKSVAAYLNNTADDVLIAALPLSFDAGFSQLTTAFHVGARVVLLNYLLPRDVLTAMVQERVTGITAVPPLFGQLAQLQWPASVNEHLRYFANTGGRLPLEVLSTLRRHFPKAAPYLMYGLTEAFRSTYLPPEEVDRRPDSMGKAIPNAEVMVLREDGTPCAPGEPGELVHRGASVAMVYWNDPQATAERFRSLVGRDSGLLSPQMAVFSGDTVRMDDDGFLYFVGRRDEMIKTSGYRVSPTEVEEVVYGTGLVAECVALGAAHPVWGQAIVVVLTATGPGDVDLEALMNALREQLPSFMLPAHVAVRSDALPRNPNGKIDRKALAQEFESFFSVGER